MSQEHLSCHIAGPENTAKLAVLLAPKLTAGDVVLLRGDVGAGKTHFARALIRTLLATPEDVPSPTFTLVQTYLASSGVEIWHSDLYRLTDPSEVDELGLIDAFETAICIVEWPDRLGALAPSDALMLTLSQQGVEDARVLQATWQDSKWAKKVAVWAE